MLGSISPVGESSRNQRWWLTATAYTVGSVLGGAATGVVLGALGQLLTGVVRAPLAGRLGLLAAVALAGAAIDTAGRWPGSGWRRQVNERWLTEYRGWVYGAGFGLQLGSGVTTIVTSAATYAAFAAALLSGSWRGGVVIGGVFGAVRSLPLLLTARLREPDRMLDVTRRVAHAQPLAHRVTAAGQLGVGAVALIATVVLL